MRTLIFIVCCICITLAVIQGPQGNSNQVTTLEVGTKKYMELCSLKCNQFGISNCKKENFFVSLTSNNIESADSDSFTNAKNCLDVEILKKTKAKILYALMLSLCNENCKVSKIPTQILKVPDQLLSISYSKERYAIVNNKQALKADGTSSIIEKVNNPTPERKDHEGNNHAKENRDHGDNNHAKENRDHEGNNHGGQKGHEGNNHGQENKRITSNPSNDHNGIGRIDQKINQNQNKGGFRN